MLPATPSWINSLPNCQAWHQAGIAAALARGASLDILPLIPTASIDLVLTDPPYFIDRMGSDWDKSRLSASRAKANVVGSMPVGMKFDPEQGRRLQAELTPVFAQCLRVLKPGGFLVAFSQARLYHRMGIAAEDAGFEIRDMLGWTYQGQAKAFSQDHFVRKMKLTATEKAALIKNMGGRKTPQLKPMIEPMVFGQKPREGTYVENWVTHQVGLIDTACRYDGKFPGNLMEARKPDRAERGHGNDHLTVKPQRVLRHLVELLTLPGAVVLDPYAGSSSTQIAALSAGRHSLGIERGQEEWQISVDRLSALANPCPLISP
jgi:site-specific DNA-methyltransferase (adenine-specific)